MLRVFFLQSEEILLLKDSCSNKVLELLIQHQSLKFSEEDCGLGVVRNQSQKYRPTRRILLFRIIVFRIYLESFCFCIKTDLNLKTEHFNLQNTLKCQVSHCTYFISQGIVGGERVTHLQSFF